MMNREIGERMLPLARLVAWLVLAFSVPMVAGAQASRSTADIAAAVSRATVGIRAQLDNERVSSGSGFVVDASGTVITNLHVVEGAKSIEIQLPTDETFPVIGVKAADRQRDIAILQVAGFDLPTVKLGNSNSVRPGERVLVIGNALGLLSNSVTAGIVSGVRDAGGYRLIQMDAAISKGNSGGPVVSDNGEVIGIATLKLTDGESLNFAVPVNYARGLLILPMTAGLGLLAHTEHTAAVDSNVPDPSERVPTATNSPLPMHWRSLTTGNTKEVRLDGDTLYVENYVYADLRRNGAVSRATLKKVGDRWEGVHTEIVNCRPMPLAPRKVCPAQNFLMTITVLTHDRIEGFGEEPLNASPAFNCRRCSFEDVDARSRSFLWRPQ